MKYVYIKDGLVADVARVNPFGIFSEAYANQFIEAPDEVEGGWFYSSGMFTAPPEPPPEVPQEVTMGQCRLALYDQHGIHTDEQFFALTDLLPANQRERAKLELRTRTTVQRDNPLVVAVCQTQGWNIDDLFIYAATL